MKIIVSTLALILFIIPFSYSQNNPIAINDTIYLMQYGTININVLANDYDSNNEAIYIDDIDEEDGCIITYADSVVTIEMIDYFSWSKLRFKYRIRNESGESDRAYVVVFIEENPDVPIPIRDVFVMDSQTEMTMDLLANDEYSGTENLIINEIIPSSEFSIEVLEDNRSVKLTTGALSGFANYSYNIVEVAGNEYISKTIDNDVFIHKNPNQPTAVTDTFSIIEGETELFDVLENDISNNSISIFSFTPEDLIQLVDNKIEYSCPIFNENYYPFTTFMYSIIDNETGLKSEETKVYISIDRSDSRPIAINDTLFVPYADTIYINPLENDISLSGSPLILLNSDTIFKYTRHMFYGNEIRSINYQCKNIDSDLISENAKIIIQVKPFDTVQIEDFELNYTIGDTIGFNPVEYTSFPDSISINARSTDLGNCVTEGQTVNYSCDFTSLNDFLVMTNGVLEDTIIITYPSTTSPFPLYYVQYVIIKYQFSEPSSTLNVNNFKLFITPFGLPFNKLNPIEHKLVSSDKTFENIKSWVGDYSNEETLRVSGEDWSYIGYDFFPGPLCTRYDGDYSSKYIRTWKISKEEIDDHILNYHVDDYQMPEAILNWPANKVEYNGNMYEQADFVDVDADGIYQPENGDFPKISGDEAVLYIINDGRYKNSANSINIDSLNVDIFTLVYAFNRPESDFIQNTFFVKYKVINKSNIDYHDFRFGQFTAYDYNPWYQYMACDTNLNTYYFYDRNSTNQFYRNRIVKSVTFLNKKMDKFLTWSDVDHRAEYLYAHMVGRYDGQFRVYHAPLWSEQAPLDYTFPSDVSDPYGWSAFTNGGMWAEAGVGSIGPEEFNSGDISYYELAFSLNYVPGIGYYDIIDESLSSISQLIECYQNDSIPGGGSFNQIPENSNSPSSPIVQIFPNPARTSLHIQTDYKDFEYYRIYSLHGQLVEEYKFSKQIDIEYLQDGFYLIQLLNGNGNALLTRKFVKQ